MNNDLISRSALKKAIDEIHQKDLKVNPLWGSIGLNTLNRLIDNAPTVAPSLNLNNITEDDIEKFKTIFQRAHSKGLLTIIEERPQGEWKEFAEFVAKEVCTDNFKDNSDSFAELACRKLVKLGLLKLDGDTYKKGGNK